MPLPDLLRSAAAAARTGELTGRIAIVTGPAKRMEAAIAPALALRAPILSWPAAMLRRSSRSRRNSCARPARQHRPLRCHQAGRRCRHGRTARTFGNGRLDILVSVAGGSGPIETVSRQTRAPLLITGQDLAIDGGWVI